MSQEIDKTAQARLLSDRPPQQIRVHLKPAEQLPTDEFSLSIWANTSWFINWVTQNHLEEITIPPCTQPKKPMRVHLWLTQEHLRFRYLPPAPSILTLFGRNLSINHQALLLNLSVNCWVELEELTHQTIRGKILSGSIQLTDLDQTVYAFAGLQNLIEQLWPDKSGTERVRSMILGRSSFQMEIATAVKRRRIAFLGKTQDMQVAGREGRLWQMIAPPDEIGSTEDYEVPSQQLEEILNTLRAATNQSNTPLSIRRGSTQGEEAGIFYHIIKIGDDVEKREIIKPDVDLVFRYAAGQTTWTPQTLRIEPLGNQTKRYELVDVDQVKWLKRGQFIALETESARSTENASGKVFEVSWNQASIPSPQVTQLPAMCLTGTASQVTAGATVVWQFGQLQEDGVNRPANVPGWIRYQIDPVPMPSKSVERGLRRLDYLTGKFIFEQVQDWRWEVDVAQGAKGGNPQAFKSRLKAELTIISESEKQHALTSLKLTIAEPEVRATTPNLHFFKAPGDRSLLDPKFLPNGKTLESVLVKTALIFRTHDPTPTGIRLTLDGEQRLTIGCDDNQVAAYIPTGQALIDPISPTGTNLVSTAGVSNDANPKQKISRDPNHGLVPVLLKQFYLDIPKDALELARLICPTRTTQESDPKVKSVLALLPWVEWEGDSQTNTSLTLHHRNLVLEQDEFLSAKEDSGTITNSRFSFKDFVAAVRDRYTQASDSLRPASRLKNWLPGAVLQDESGNQLTPELTIDTDNTGLPRVKVALKSPSGELSQYLSLQTHESWLQFGLNWQGLSAEQAPIFKLKADTSASLVNSAAPLVFDQSQRYVYDNLGVIRERLPALTESPWLIERIRYPQDSGTYQTVYSVSYFNSEKALIQSGDADENSTEISFTCAALKLQKDGTLVDADALFSTARFELGSYGFFRTPTPTPPGWKDLDCWPRLAGMPIFVTKLLRLELEADKPKIIQFQAVLVNPYDVAENYQPGQQAVPSFVGEAIARGSLLTITLTASDSTFELTEVTGNIDWTFSLTAQSPPLDPPGFPGRLARLVGTVKLEKGKLAIEPEPEKCQAYVFGQLWSLQECPTLVCTGNQTRITVKPIEPIAPGDFTLTIACDAPQSGTLEFNLPVQIESPISGYNFKAAIKSVKQESNSKSVKQLDLQLVFPNGRVTSAFAAIVQGMYYGFFLEDPIDYDKNTPSYRFGRSLLVLWLESQTSDPKLGGVLIQEDAPEFAQLTLIAPSQAAVTPPQKMTLKGVRMRMQIVSSNPASPQQEILSWYLKNDSEKVSLHIGEQVVETPIDPSDSSPVNSRLTGYLVWKPESDESPEIQGPIVLQHYQNDEYEVIPAVYYAQRVNVEPESGTTQRDFSLPRLQPDTPSQAFDLVETSRTSSQENGFVKLRFNGITFELAKLAAGQVPIDLYLDQEFIQAIATLPLKVPQLIHREVYGARLRMAIADFEGIDSTYEFSDEAIPWSVTEHQWLLAPVVKDNQMSQIMLLQGSLFLKPGSGAQQQEFQTENLFVIQRPLELPDEPMSAIARLPLTNLLSVTSRIPLDKADKGLSVFFDEQQVEDYLLKKGASGIAVHRLLRRKVLQSDQEGDRGLYRFMPSPFYAGGLTASASKEVSAGVSLAKVFQPLTAEKLSNTSLSKHTQAATPLFLDFRLLLPQNLVNVQLKLLSRYCPVQSSSTPSNQSSLPQRVIKFERNVPQPNTPDQLEHHIHALEATAFAQMEHLGFPPEFVISTSDTKPKPVTFLPQNLELCYAADKPGAMFHHKLQAYTMPKSEAAVEVELMADVALREPQQFKPPVGAAIEITNYEPKSLQTLKLTDMQFCKIKLQWKEVLGQVALKELTNKQPIAVKDDKLAAEPFKLIVQIEQSVQEIRRTDAVIPITAITDGATSTTQRIYIVTRLQNLDLGIALQRENEPEPAQYKLFIKNENDDKQLVSFETYFQQVKDVNTDPYIVWKYKGGGVWSELTKLKAVWQPTTKTHAQQEIPYFEYQIQRIPPSGLSAKIAVIHSLRRKERPNLDRTLLFGNAASLDTANFEIQEDEFQFSTYGEDTVDAIVNNLPDASEHLFLVKYLTEGQTLFTQR